MTYKLNTEKLATYLSTDTISSSMRDLVHELVRVELGISSADGGPAKVMRKNLLLSLNILEASNEEADKELLLS